MNIIDTPEGIAKYRIATLRAGLRLECKGMMASRGLSCFAIVKREFGFKGNKASVLAQLEKWISENNSCN